MKMAPLAGIGMIVRAVQMEKKCRTVDRLWLCTTVHWNRPGTLNIEGGMTRYPLQRYPISDPAHLEVVRSPSTDPGPSIVSLSVSRLSLRLPPFPAALARATAEV